MLTGAFLLSPEDRPGGAAPFMAARVGLMIDGRTQWLTRSPGQITRLKAGVPRALLLGSELPRTLLEGWVIVVEFQWTEPQPIRGMSATVTTTPPDGSLYRLMGHTAPDKGTPWEDPRARGAFAREYVASLS